MDLNQNALTDIAFDAAADGIVVPPGLRRRVLDSTDLGVRRPMHPQWAEDSLPTSTNAFLAFVRTAAELAELLADLAPEEWERPTATPAGSVRDLISHLVGVERYALGQLGRRPPRHAPTREDHFPVSRSAAHDTIRLSADELSRTWWLEVTAVVRACGELGPAEQLVLHHLPLSVRGFLVVRTFELWTHGDDIRRATGRDLDLLDADRLSLMSRALIDALPFGMAICGTERPGRTLRVVLTGRGGASFDVALVPGGPVGTPDATLTMSTLDLCRVAARRLPIDEAEMAIEDDRGLVEAVLVGAQAFAAD